MVRSFNSGISVSSSPLYSLHTSNVYLIERAPYHITIFKMRSYHYLVERRYCFRISCGVRLLLSYQKSDLPSLSPLPYEYEIFSYH